MSAAKPLVRLPAAKVPQMRRHKAKNLAYVNLSGHMAYLGAWGSAAAAAEYDRVVIEFLANGRRLPSGGQDTTIAELVKAYFQFADGYYQTRTTGELDPLHRALDPLVEWFGHDMAVEFGPLKLKTLRERWIKEGRVRSQINKAVQRVIRCFKWGVENELVPGETLHRLKAIAGLRAGRSAAKESKPVLPVDDADVDAVLLRLPLPVRGMVELQRLTGMRPGEVIQMTPAMIDQRDAVWAYRPRLHKTQHCNKSRVVFFGPQAKLVLGPFLECRDFDVPLFSPAEATEAARARRAAARQTPINQGNRPGSNIKQAPRLAPGETYSTTSYARAIRRACEKVWPTRQPEDDEKVFSDDEIAANAAHHWHPNQLRHSFATRVRKAHGLEAAQVLLGHSRADVTQVYAERDEAKAAAVAAQIG